MIRFILKGLFRDRSRSLFPILIIAAGVALTVLLSAWIQGTLQNMIETSARFATGHLKVQTRALLSLQQTGAIDLSLIEANSLRETLEKDYPENHWLFRIHFGGLLDFPDEQGETWKQGPVAGMGVDLSPDSVERELLNLEKALVRGKLPSQPGEILVSEAFFAKLTLQLNQKASLISSDMDGAMSVYNFKVVGTVTFGVAALDRGAVLADVEDVRLALNMEDATTEVLGFFRDQVFRKEKAAQIAADFNQKQSSTDEFSPKMVTLREQNNLGDILDTYEGAIGSMLFMFIFIIAVVLWNTGLMNGIRRYGEIGLRLAMGENKTHLYLSLVIEAFFLGVFGFLLGIVLGLIPAYYLQEVGLDVSGMLQNSESLMSGILKAKITPTSIIVGLLPGVFAPFLGALISGIPIFRRNTSMLFKELET